MGDGDKKKERTNGMDKGKNQDKIYKKKIYFPHIFLFSTKGKNMILEKKWGGEYDFWGKYIPLLLKGLG